MPRPVLLLLSRGEVEEVHARSLELLWRVGVWFEDPEVAKILLEAGAEEAPGGRVRIPEWMVREALSRAPKGFKLYDRDGRLVAELGSGALVFNPGSAAIRLLEPGGVRGPRLEDLRRLVVLVDALEGFDAQSTALVPVDVPVEIRDAVRLYVVLKYSRKPVVTGAFTVENLGVMVEMLRAVREDYDRRPFAIFDVCPSPPLSWSRVTSRNLVDLARLGVPAEIISMPGLGSTAPVTVAGALVQHHAEVLSGVVLAETVRPGAPVVYGGSPGVTHMRYGTMMITGVEAVLVSLAYRDMARVLGLPVHTYMGLADSKALDYQAGLETGYTMFIAALAGFDVVSGPGMLEFEETQSLEKLVLDSEACMMAKRLARGFSLDMDHLALDVIEDVVLGRRARLGFLAHPHTRKYYREELYTPRILDYSTRSRWDGLRAEERVQRIVREILESHEPPVLEGERLERLDQVYGRLWRSVGREPVAV